MKIIKFLLPLLALPALAQAQAAAGDAASNVRVWALPAGEPVSRDFKVEAEGQPVFVEVTHVAPADDKLRWKAMDDKMHSADYFALASFASLDMRGPVKNICVTFRDEVKQAKILPSSYGIVPRINGRQVSFPLDHPANLTIEINGDTTSSLHLFANPWETTVRRVARRARPRAGGGNERQPCCPARARHH